jgi:PAS domain S-box-containing protein
VSSSELADSIVKTLREPLVVLDNQLRVTNASPAFFRSFKVSKEQTIGRRIYELGNHEWDIPALRKLLERILPHDDEFNDLTVEHDFPNIGPRTMLLNGRRLHDDGKTDFILLAIEDITDRRRSEMEIARQRAWFQTTLSSIGDAVIATDAEACVTFLNPVAETMTGWKSNEARGQPLQQVLRIVNEETRNTVESPVTKAIRLGSIVGLANHTLLIARDGAERPIDDSAAPIRDEDKAITGVVMVFHDITERRIAEKQIEISEARYRRLFEAAQDGILILDSESGRVIDVNRFMTDLLRHPRQHFLGKQLWEIGVFQDIEASKAAMRELQERGYVRYEDLPLVDRDGRPTPVEFVSNRYHEDGRIVFQCNIRDISQRKQIEHQREVLLLQEHAARVEAQAAERANRSKDVFLATLSHEMRTPLNAILGWAKILRAEDCSSEDLQEGLEVIERNAKAQATLIEDVLDVSRIVSGQLRLEPGRCDFRSFITAAIETVQTAAKAKGIQISFEIETAAESSTISCDAHRMQQVIWNLLSNAVKFSPQNSKVTVFVARHPSGVEIRVKDNGPGIGPEFLPFVFDRFRQADSSSKRRFGGLGLGLSIVKHIVELHGGTVQAESGGEGMGSIFTVNLPLRAAGPTDVAADELNITRPEQSTVRLDGLRLLVVDDDADARRLLARVLGEVGAIVTLAASPQEAMHALRDPTQMPHLLISDLSMPDEDGFDMIREIRNAGHSVQKLPAIAVTAFADKGNARSAILAGYQVHVPKPVDPIDLIANVASLMGRTGPSSKG